MDVERWLPVVAHPGYEVSDQGRVRSWRGTHGRRREPYVMIGSSHAKGYRLVTLRGRTLKVHGLVLSAFTGPRPPGCEGRHLNGDPRDNRLDNLQWGTHAENRADQVRHGTNQRGETASRVKLTEAQVREIRRRSLYEGTRALAREFGVRHATIANVVHRRSWTHLTEEVLDQ